MNLLWVLKVDEDHLELGDILVVLVHFSTLMVSHARKNIIYPNDMSEYHHLIVVKDMILLSYSSISEEGVVDTWPY